MVLRSCCALRNTKTAAQIAEVAGGEVPRDLTIETLLAILSEPERLNKLQASIVRPLKDLKLAPYYGCLLTRPPEVVHFDDPSLRL